MDLSTKKLVKGTVLGMVQGLLSQVPYFGPAVTGAWQGYSDARDQDLMNQFKNRIEALESTNVDTDYIASEEYYDLFLRCVRIHRLHRSQEKARVILNVLLESLKTDRDERFNISLKEIFLDRLDLMTDQEMEFLRAYNRGEYTAKSKNDIYQGGNDQAAVALDALIAKGILREEDTWEKKVVDSMLGREFIAYLKHISQDE